MFVAEQQFKTFKCYSTVYKQDKIWGTSKEVISLGYFQQKSREGRAEEKKNTCECF